MLPATIFVNVALVTISAERANIGAARRMATALRSGAVLENRLLEFILANENPGPVRPKRCGDGTRGKSDEQSCQWDGQEADLNPSAPPVGQTSRDKCG